MSTPQSFPTDSFAFKLSELLPLSDLQIVSEPLPSTGVEIQQILSVPVSESIPRYANRIKIRIILNKTKKRDGGCEADFNKSFDRFFQKYCSDLKFTLMFFLILIIGDSQLFALTLLAGLFTAYLIDLGMAFYKAETSLERCRTIYQIIELLGGTISAVWTLINFNQPTVFLICLLISYLFKSIVGYCCNRSKLIEFINQVNGTILVLRICVFFQGIFLLIQESMGFKFPRYSVYIPLYLIILILARFVGQLLKSIYFTCYEQFWSTAFDEKKAGVKYIFGNLFALIGILLLQSLILLFDWSEVEMLVFLAIVAWCTISLLLSESRHNAVFKVSEALANGSNENVSIHHQTDPNSEFQI